MADTKYLIIGNAAAGIGGVSGIRQVDSQGSITLLSSEARHTYSRPLISYWLEGKVTEGAMAYREMDFYKINGVDARLGVVVRAIDPQGKKVTLADGTAITYEKLLVATGSRPFVPPIEGRELAKNAFTFTTMDDAQAIAQVLTSESRVVILGAGLIGLKAAEAMVDQCAAITVVDLADHVLPSVLDAQCGAMAGEHLENLGMTLRLKTSITKIAEDQVILSDGEALPYDVLILAVGTRPESTLVEAAGGVIGRGIVTDDTQATSLVDVYAAGDCTQSHDMTSDTDKNLAILPNAFMQGETAGINMAGGEATYREAFPVNAMGLKGFYMLTAGSYLGEVQVVDEGESYRKFFGHPHEGLQG